MHRRRSKCGDRQTMCDSDSERVGARGLDGADADEDQRECSDEFSDAGRSLSIPRCKQNAQAVTTVLLLPARGGVPARHRCRCG
jgi:hypothetical protein